MKKNTNTATALDKAIATEILSRIFVPNYEFDRRFDKYIPDFNERVRKNRK